MPTKHTFSTFLWLQTTRAINKEALLYVRITVDGKRVNLSLKKRIPIILWDPKKKKAKSITAQSKQINLYIDEVSTKLFQVYQDLKFKGELIKAQLVKAHYSGESDQGKTFKNIFDYHTQKIENMLAAGTIRNFGITENYVFKFLKKQKNTTGVSTFDGTILLVIPHSLV